VAPGRGGCGGPGPGPGGVARGAAARRTDVGMDPLCPRRRVHGRAKVPKAHARGGEPDRLCRPALPRSGVLLEVGARYLAGGAAAAERRRGRGGGGGARGAPLGGREAGLAVAVDEALDGDLARQEDGPGDEGGGGGSVCSPSPSAPASSSSWRRRCRRRRRPPPASPPSPPPPKGAGRGRGAAADDDGPGGGGPPAKLDPLPRQRPRPQHLPERRRAPGWPGPGVARAGGAEHQRLEQPRRVAALRGGPARGARGVRRPRGRPRHGDAAARADRRAARAHHRAGRRRRERRGPQRRRAEAPAAAALGRGPSLRVAAPFHGHGAEGRRGGGRPAVGHRRARRVAHEVRRRQQARRRRGAREARGADEQVGLVRALVRTHVRI